MAAQQIRHARLRGEVAAETQRLGARRERLLAEHRRDKAQLEKLIAHFWQPAFDLFQHLILECRALCGRMHDGSAKCLPVFTAKTHLGLYSRGLVTTSEVIELLRSGHGHGALSRWRTQIELAAFAEFIRSKGDEAATRYVDHYDVGALRYLKAQWPAIDQPTTKAEADTVALYVKLAKRVEGFKTQYGAAFVKDLGWASKWLPGRIKIRDIINASGLEMVASEYKAASYYVHADGRGSLDHVQFTHKGIKLRATASDEAISHPGRLSAYTLMLHSSILVQACKPGKAEKTFWTINELANETREAFHSCHTKWFNGTGRDKLDGLG